MKPCHHYSLIWAEIQFSVWLFRTHLLFLNPGLLWCRLYCQCFCWHWLWCDTKIIKVSNVAAFRNRWNFKDCTNRLVCYGSLDNCWGKKRDWLGDKAFCLSLELLFWMLSAYWKIINGFQSDTCHLLFDLVDSAQMWPLNAVIITINLW